MDMGESTSEGNFTMDVCLFWGTNVPFLGTKTPYPDWLVSVKALLITGMVIAALATMMNILRSFTHRWKHKDCLFNILICVCFAVAGIFILSGDIVFSLRYKELITETPQRKSLLDHQSVFISKEEAAELKDIAKLIPEIQKIEENGISLRWGFAVDIVCALMLMVSVIIYLVVISISVEAARRPEGSRYLHVPDSEDEDDMPFEVRSMNLAPDSTAVAPGSNDA